jgi:hypothetical protein
MERRLHDRLAKDGALVKRKLPGRKRAAGILESDVLTPIAQGTSFDCCALLQFGLGQTAVISSQ